MDVRKEFTCNNKSKTDMRRDYAALRNAVRFRHERGVAAAERILPLLSGNVMVYVSIGSEMPTDTLIRMLTEKATATVYVPFTDNDYNVVPRKLKKIGLADKLGNLESTNLYAADGVNIDYCVTPLLAFGRDGSRLGYGKGCYDRFFSSIDTYKIGFAYDCQAADFSGEKHDVPLDCCVTESKVIYF